MPTFHMDEVNAVSPTPSPVTTAPSSTPDKPQSSGNWFSQNAPKQSQTNPSLDKEVKTSSRHFGQTKEPPKPIKLPPGTKVLGSPILPVEGIIFTEAADLLSKLDKALGVTGQADPKIFKGAKPNSQILGGPVTPKPGEAHRGGEAAEYRKIYGSPASTSIKPVQPKEVTATAEEFLRPLPFQSGTGTQPLWDRAKAGPPGKRKSPPLTMSDAALSQVLKVEAPGAKRDALIAEATKRGVEVPKLETHREQATDTLSETARVDQQFDEAEKKLAAKQKSQSPPKARKTAKPPFIPETGIPENIARTQDARERIIGKPPDRWTNADILAADELISEGYTGASGSTAPEKKAKFKKLKVKSLKASKTTLPK